MIMDYQKHLEILSFEEERNKFLTYLEKCKSKEDLLKVCASYTKKHKKIDINREWYSSDRIEFLTSSRIVSERELEQSYSPQYKEMIEEHLFGSIVREIQKRKYYRLDIDKNYSDMSERYRLTIGVLKS